MQPLLNFAVVVFLITVILSLLAGLVLVTYSGKGLVNNRWLGAFYLSAGYGFLVAFLLLSRLVYVFPWFHTYRTAYFLGFLLMPFSYFYYRSLLLQKRFRPADFLHFLPALVFLIDMLPFYLQPAAYKIQQIQQDLKEMNFVWSQFSQGWLGIGDNYVPIRILLTTLYWIVEVRMLIKARRNPGGGQLLQENRTVLVWLTIFAALQASFFLPYYLNLLLGKGIYFFFMAHTLLAMGISITIIILLFQPQILYGLKGIITRDATYAENPAATPTPAAGVTTGQKETEPLSTTEPEAQPVYLSRLRLDELAATVENYVTTEKIYLRKGITAGQLAQEINVQPYILSAMINQVYKTNFNDYLNGYRIRHALELIEKGEAKFLTFEALSEKCGFNNRNSFTSAFKKHTGLTPSEFNRRQPPPQQSHETAAQ